MNTTEIFDLGQLAEAAYGNFVDNDGDLIAIEDELQNILRGLKLDTATGQVVKDEDSSMSFSETQAIRFTDSWAVVAHQPDTDSGFSATLFRHKGTGGFNDLVLTDGGDIVTDGLAIHQIVDLYRDWSPMQPLAAASLI
jgi:hypothetical protein